MTEEEFDVLDELYFIQSFTELQELTGKKNKALDDILKHLYEKGWIKIYQSVDEELQKSEVDLPANSGHYYYLASKKGLLAHNSIN